MSNEFPLNFDKPYGKNYIYTNNNGHRVISRGLDVIADTDTMGNNLIARMDVDIVVSDVIDAYIQQLNQRVYGK